MKEIILLKYGELALKGANRSTFEAVLLKNIRRRLKDLGDFKVNKSQSTITVEPLNDDCSMDDAFWAVERVFGISALSRSAVCEKNMDSILSSLSYLEDSLEEAKTFKVTAKRSDKTFPLTSPQICMEAGAYILEKYPHLSVDVHDPDFTVAIEVRDHNAYIHGPQLEGAGGIPVGTGGKATLLLSGGIDSPVAGYMMAKRGLEICAVHFASPPYTSERAKQKVLKLCKKLIPYTGRIRTYVVNFTKIQDEIAKHCKEEYFTIIMRRFMMEIASVISESKGAEALITGESLGQVASQTMQALACTDASSKQVVLRPLIGMDKSEIVLISRKIDTFETSCLPYEDCCTVFTPAHPRTRPSLQLVMEEEKNLDREALINEAVQTAENILIDNSYEI